MLRAESEMLNKELPLIMHIDLNCCFAIIEQQANRLLRGRPVAVSAYSTPRGMVLASSYEAKRLGVKLGVNNGEARIMAPGIVILTPDPSKYREAHIRFKRLLLEYTSDVTPKSIDEFVLDFAGAPAVSDLRSQISDLRKNQKSKLQDPSSKILAAHNKRMLEIGREIKQRIHEELGEWVTVNIGIGTNRFLAKYAAGFGKPDGMTLIDHRNMKELYRADPHRHRPMELIDLPGINTRYAARLMACGVMNPLQFYQADIQLLKKIVFKSVVGYYWWARLRGHEVDNRTFKTRSIGHQYAIPKKTKDIKELERLLMKLCEKVGRRLRKKNYCARGIHLYLGFSNNQVRDYRNRKPSNVVSNPRVSDPGYETSGEHLGFENMHKLRSWHEGHKLNHRLYATVDIFEATRHLLQKAPLDDSVNMVSITVYDLEPWDPEQLSIFDQDLRSGISDLRNTVNSSYAPRSKLQDLSSTKRLSDAMDAVNTRYGEFVITPGTMMDMKGEILDRIAFSSTPPD